MNSTTVEVIRFEVRSNNNGAFQHDTEEAAQEHRSWLADRCGWATIHRRTETITTVVGDWEEIQAVVPEVPEWARDSFDVLDAPVAAGDTE